MFVICFLTLQIPQTKVVAIDLTEFCSWKNVSPKNLVM